MKIFIFEDNRPIDNEVPVIVIRAKSVEEALIYLAVTIRVGKPEDYSLVEIDEDKEGVIYSNYLL